MFVIDASALVELLLGTPRSVALATRVAASGESLHAPHLIDLEVASVFRTFESKGTIAPTLDARMIADLGALDAHALRARRADAAHLAAALTTYDAAYVALAEVLRAPLVTLDANLANAPGHRARIDLYA